MVLNHLKLSIYRRKEELFVSKNGREKWSKKLNLEPKGMHARSVTYHLSKSHVPYLYLLAQATLMQIFDKAKCMRSHVIDEDPFDDHVSIVLNLEIK